MTRQTDICFGWWNRWGCFNHSDVPGIEDLTGYSFSKPQLEEAIREGLDRPVPWRPGKHVFDRGPDGTSWWNYDPDWWLQLLADIAAPGQWEVFQVGEVKPSGELVWYCDQTWWPKIRGPIRSYSWIKDKWARPHGGGHYTYYNPYLERAWNPDPSLRPLGVATGERLIAARRIA